MSMKTSKRKVPKRIKPAKEQYVSYGLDTYKYVLAGSERRAVVRELQTLLRISSHYCVYMQKVLRKLKEMEGGK
jgi:hypothetical protein